MSDKSTIKKPALTVLMCARNASAYIRPAIESVLRQSFTDFEFIIFENCSSDNTWEIIKSYQDSRIRAFQTDIPGLTFNLNSGLLHASASIIARMDADDVSHHDRFSRQLAFLERHPEVDVLGTGFTIFGSGISPSQVMLPASDQEIRGRLPFKFSLCHPSVMFKRDVVLRAGGYAGGRYSQDLDLWMRLARTKSVVFSNLPDSLLFYRVHGGQAKGRGEAYAEVSAILSREMLISKSARLFFAWIVACVKYFFCASNRN